MGWVPVAPGKVDANSEVNLTAAHDVVQEGVDASALGVLS